MMRKKLISMALAGLTAISITACSKANNESDKYGTLPKELWRDIKYSRYSVPEDKDVKKKELEQFLYKYKNFNGESNHNSINLNLELKEEISKNDAINDLEYFFNDLKFSYAGYEYFGGEKVFNDKKIKIQSKIQSMGTNIKTLDFENLLLDELRFIKDNKFYIGNESVAPSKKYISNEELNILKDDKGYYIEENNKKLYLKYAEVDQIEKNIKISLDKDGNLKYVLGKLSYEREEDMTLNLYDGLNYSKKTVILRYKEPKMFEDILCKASKFNGVELIENRRLNVKNDKEKESLKEMAERIKTLNDEKYVIVDLRGNNGGIEPYPSNWVEAMTQGFLSSNMLWADLKTNTVVGLDKLSSGSKLDKEQFTTNIDIGNEIKVKPVVVVLLDDNIKASGEILVNSLKYIDNVMFVGTNTAGSMLTTNILKNVLPNSGIKTSYGSCIGFNTHFNNIDGDGFQPHIWINDDDAVEKTVKFLNKNKLDIK